jgi:hypothetical protein
MKVDKTYICRYKTNSKKSSQGIKDRKLIITKEPHYNKRFKKGKIITAIDMSDPNSKKKFSKVFYIKNFITTCEYNLRNGIEEANPPTL